jgi:hypothetical protein
MDGEINSIFIFIIALIAVITVVGVLIVILFESALPLNISNASSGIFATFILIGIGALFYNIPETTTKTYKSGKKSKLDTHFITYLLLLFIITFVNIIF